jgi:hypothetical protein
MPDIEEEVIGSQSDENQEEDTELAEVLKAFDIDPVEEKEEKSVNDKTPAKEDVKTETRIEKVKHNKEETDVDISTTEKLHDHLQRSLALDKERERKTELENNLDRAAKLAGYKDHAAYVADFDNIEKQQQQKEQSEHDQLLTELREQAEDAGLDPDKVEAYLKNHPLVKEGEKLKQERKAAADQADAASKWLPLYQEYPELAESVNKANGLPVEWYTPELEALIARGNDPLLAYNHLNKDKIQQQTKKATEQRLIKEQQLGLRSRVESNTAPNNEQQIPAEMASAFAAFDLPIEAARKYIKK